MSSITIPITNAAFVRKENPSTNYATSPSLRVGTISGTTDRTNRSYLDFTSSQWDNIPVGSIVTDVTLYIYCYDKEQGSNNDLFYHCHQVTQDWSEGNITWNNRPSHGTLLTTSSASLDDTDTLTLDDIAYDIYHNISGARSKGVCLKIDDENHNYDNLLFFASDNHGTSSWQPYLRVYYDPPPPPVFSTALVNTLKTAINLSGTFDTSIITKVQIQSSIDNINFSYFGDATLSGSNWTAIDTAIAPVPSIPQTSLSVINGDDIRISWSSVSQSSLTKYYRVYGVLTDGSNTSNSSVKTVVFIPSITKYSIERFIEGGSWTKIGEVDGTATQYVDTTLPLNISAQYRVIATNSQNSNSGTLSQAITIVPPTPPIFSSLDVINETTFRLSGSGAIIGEQ